MTDLSNADILAELGVEAKVEKKAKLSAKEERIIAGFEEIQSFVEEHGHAPMHGEDKDIFERIYAIRLEQIRNSKECRDLVLEQDHQNLLEINNIAEPSAVYNSDKELLAHLGVDTGSKNDITELKHVKSQAQKQREKAAEIGAREPCKDFEIFKPIFDAAQADLKSGVRKALPFSKDGSIEAGNLFILGGQKALVALVGDEFIGKDGRKEYRLRVIFDNGVESNQLMRSLQKRLWEDETARRISVTDHGPLFDDVANEDDLSSGTIYVLRSKSNHPSVAENRDIIHKIGVTGGKVEKRIANAKVDPTFLMADVEVVATYELFNINRTKLEHLLHKFFDVARLDIEIADRFGNPVAPKEWFLMPLFVIDEVIEKIRDSSISEYMYDHNKAVLVKR